MHIIDKSTQTEHLTQAYLATSFYTLLREIQKKKKRQWAFTRAP